MVVAAALAAGCESDSPGEAPAARPGVLMTAPSGSEPAAVEVAERTLEAMGGRAAWERTRYLAWTFFGSRDHVWDKWTGDVRVKGTDRASGRPYLVLMNLGTGQGRAWRDGAAVTAPDALREMLDGATGAWINDSYWLLMPYKLRDPGVRLRHLGHRDMDDGREAEVLELTFQSVGRTPQNMYHVYCASDSGLIEQWDFFASASDDEPAFSSPWRDWQRYGDIMLSGDRGQMRGRPARLTNIAVFDTLPSTVFTSPEPVELGVR